MRSLPLTLRFNIHRYRGLEPRLLEPTMRSISAFMRNAACAAVLGVASLASAHAARAAGEVNIYSYREPGLINPLLAAFTQRDGHQDQRGVRLERSHRAPRRRGQEQPRRSPADAGVRSAASSRSRPASRSRCIPELLEQGDPGQAARRQGPVVRPDAARARRLRLEGSRQAGYDHLRGAGRSRSGAARSASAPVSTPTTSPSSPR